MEDAADTEVGTGMDISSPDAVDAAPSHEINTSSEVKTDAVDVPAVGEAKDADTAAKLRQDDVAVAAASDNTGKEDKEATINLSEGDTAAESDAAANNAAAGKDEKEAATKLTTDNTTAAVPVAVTSDNAGDKNDIEAANAQQDGDENKEPTEPPSRELTLEDVYNPRNLTMDELEMLLYEWEQEATSVHEYLDMRIIHKMRLNLTDDEEEGEDEGKEEEKPKKSWMGRLKDRVSHYDDGSKTQVEFKKGPTHYLNLTGDSAHVVEFYAPVSGQQFWSSLACVTFTHIFRFLQWCPHCQNYKWAYIGIAAEVQRRSISPGW